jgi:hypothetical protein
MFTFETDGGGVRGGDKSTLYTQKLACEDDLYTVTLASFFLAADLKK